MLLYDTASRNTKELPPLHSHPEISMYACGPTVYDETHIGHMRKYVMDDLLRCTLELQGYTVKHVMNITDVGHLTGDDDSGDDKLEKGALKQGKTVWEIARYFEERFHSTMSWLGVTPPLRSPRATEHITEMIELIKRLEAKGMTYVTDEAVYFDTSAFPRYGALSGQLLADKMQASRNEVVIDTHKKHPVDFALWFRRQGRFANHTMHWESPWGDGFPGWHVECSAMSMKYLGETINIHTGGIDHIPVHHENEIAQSEGATGKPFVNWWVHHAFLMVQGEKMSKSKGNFYTMQDIQNKGYESAAVRYLFYQAHYRKSLNFTWEALEAAARALDSLRAQYAALSHSAQVSTLSYDKKLLTKFTCALSDDLNSSESLAVVWNCIKDNSISPKTRIEILDAMDSVLKLNLKKGSQQKMRVLTEKGYEILLPHEAVPDAVIQLVRDRHEAKQQRDFKKADALRTILGTFKVTIEDIPTGYLVKHLP